MDLQKGGQYNDSNQQNIQKNKSKEICAPYKKCKSRHVYVRLELTFPAKGHYNCP